MRELEQKKIRIEFSAYREHRSNACEQRMSTNSDDKCNNSSTGFKLDGAKLGWMDGLMREKDNTRADNE